MNARSCLLAACLLASATAAAADLDVTVAGLRTHEGMLMLSVVDAAGWDGAAKPVAADRRKPQGDSETFHFSGLAAGTYAVRVMHDENGNGKLDANLVGMPTEGYGFSNDPKVARKPTFDEAKFELGAGGGAITLHLR
jgi:uncharacterized protein (DUF2141 family)